jgi:hypothetical protein
MRLLNIIGPTKAQIVMHNMQHRKQYTFLLTSGPTHWLNIFIGFNDHSILPSGAGKNGE